MSITFKVLVAASEMWRRDGAELPIKDDKGLAGAVEEAISAIKSATTLASAAEVSAEDARCVITALHIFTRLYEFLQWNCDQDSQFDVRWQEAVSAMISPLVQLDTLTEGRKEVFRNAAIEVALAMRRELFRDARRGVKWWLDASATMDHLQG